MKGYVLDASVVLTFLLGKDSSFKNNFIKILNQVKKGRLKLYSSYLLPLEVCLLPSPLYQDSKFKLSVWHLFL